MIDIHTIQHDIVMANESHKIQAKLDALLSAKKIIDYETIKRNHSILLYQVRAHTSLFYLLFKYPDTVYLIKEDISNRDYNVTKYENYIVFLQNITNYIKDVR